MNRPQTQFVAVGDADVAYQSLGQGPPDLLLFNGLGSHVELNWQIRDYRDIFTRLASFSRLIMFDRRGTGASSEAPAHATWEEFTEDARAVLHALGTERVAILAAADSAPTALLFAAMHPDRLLGLVLVNSFAGQRFGDDDPTGMTLEERIAQKELVRTMWGTTDLMRLATPSRADDEEFLEVTAATCRASMTPRKFADYVEQSMTIDVTSVLPLIQVPTLVLHSKDNRFHHIETARFLADHIDGAKFVELPGGDSNLWGDSVATIAEETAEFLTGQRPIEVERILTTVLFTDISDSTARAASLGDRRWRSLLDAHDDAVRKQLGRFRGREINTTGDGFVASFQGPGGAIRCASAIIEATRTSGLALRVGIHAGECEVRGDDLGGLAVHIAARVGAIAAPGEVLVSSTVKDLVVGSDIAFQDRGEHSLKGVPGSWRLFAVGSIPTR